MAERQRLATQESIAVIGLGYVGLPLALAFAEKYPVVGFDLNPTRIAELQRGVDRTAEVEPAELEASSLVFASSLADIAHCSCYIVTVPTPVDQFDQPDFTPLISASRTVAQLLDEGDLVIYESTVYPGATREVCVPELVAGSGLEFDRQFHVGYSPERINPGDKQRPLSSIVKVTSGSSPAAAERVDALYKTIITAGTYPAGQLEVAEAAKVIENVQRDVNIALMNELAVLFNRLGIDTLEVLEAAGSKWNFLPFRPGLVGGHCIGVDPYYLIRKAQAVGHHPEIIQASRRINNQMGGYLANQVIRLMLEHDVAVNRARVLVLGLTFKENCPDLRNSRVIDVVNEFGTLGMEVDVHDPWADRDDAAREYGVTLVDEPKADSYDAIVVAVGHALFYEAGVTALRRWGKPAHVVYDAKCLFARDEVDGRL